MISLEKLSENLKLAEIREHQTATCVCLFLKKLGLVIRAGQDFSLHISCCCGAFLVVSVLKRWGWCWLMAVLVCVPVCLWWGLNPAANPPWTGRGRSIWMSARSSELIFTIIFLLWGASAENTVESCQLLPSALPFQSAHQTPLSSGTLSALYLKHFVIHVRINKELLLTHNVQLFFSF